MLAELWGHVSVRDVQRRMAECQLPAHHCNVTWHLEPHVARSVFDDMLREAGVRVLYEAQLDSVSGTGGELRELRLTTGERVNGRVFIEGSYEGDLLAAANVSTIIGRESASTYHEANAGMHAKPSEAVEFPSDSTLLPPATEEGDAATYREGAGDARVQAYNFRICATRRRNASVPFSLLRPAGHDQRHWELLRQTSRLLPPAHRSRVLRHLYPMNNMPSCSTKPVPNGKFDVNNCGFVSTDFVGGSSGYAEATHAQRRAIWHAHREYTEGLLYTLATDEGMPARARVPLEWGLCADEFGPKMRGFPPSLYVREARRLVGPRVFTERTPYEQQKRRYPHSRNSTSIGLGCYTFDSHATRRLMCRSAAQCHSISPPPRGASKNASFVVEEGWVASPTSVYQIPHYVMMPRRSEAMNVLAASTPSASHVGMSSLRMEQQFMIIGHAAGAMAALAVAKAKEVSAGTTDVHAVPLESLNAALREDGAILSVPPPSPPPYTSR